MLILLACSVSYQVPDLLSPALGGVCGQVPQVPHTQSVT